MECHILKIITHSGAKNLHLSLDTVMYFEIKEYMKKPLLKGEFNSLY